ncbi:sushi repeat-containing protein SRPX2 [Neolamprologus brichardi]|uniref:sushi repeat-containing protein SRPX2 n=1 Tax=Neolamprologus brichardi TaxID=32507 RepID=UPI0003EC5B43|nr:sushi repeat-containing protein SRPX2 [Neolamprologus brichardi]
MENAGSGTTVDENEFTEEDTTPQLDYTYPYWCHPPGLTNGEVTCHSPRGRAYRSTLGTRCQMSCDRGYKLLGRRSIMCLANRSWSGTAYCRTCKFLVRVEVRRCPELFPPLHGYLSCSSDGSNYGAMCEYHCEGGHERRGVSSRVCQFNRSWGGDPAECVPIEIKADVKTAPALLDQFYEKRRLLIVSAPNMSDPDYQLQNIMIQKADCGLALRHVTVIELLGSPPRETGRIKESLLQPQVIEGLRQAFRISRSYFSMVLLDELGLDRERFISPVGSDELFSYIDSFLLDEEEREKLELRSDFCD